MADRVNHVFLNCPFDRTYQPIFEAVVFAVQLCGHHVRCALEENNSGEIRLDRLCRMIDDCPRSIHDLSRTELNEQELPRFNMPFELGLAVGARQLGGKARQSKALIVMVSEPYRMPIYLSDLGGNDPFAHGRDPARAIAAVRGFLRAGDGAPAPGARTIASRLAHFHSELPSMAKRRRIDPDELDSLTSFPDFLYFVSTYLDEIR